MNKTVETELNLHKAFDYAPTPALRVDTAGCVTRINIALRSTFGEQCNGCCHDHYSKLSSRLTTSGAVSLLPTEGMAERRNRKIFGTQLVPFETLELQVSSHVVAVRSERFGELSMHVTEVPNVSTFDGNWTGSTIWLEIINCSDVTVCRKTISDALSHELLWDLYASSYDEILPEMFFYREALTRHCELLADRQIHRVVDIGAGTGLQMERLLSIGKSVTAVETSRAMLARLCWRAARASPNSVRIIEESAENLPQLHSGSFDAATILLAFFDMDDPWQALKEAQRLLASGGILVFTEPKKNFNVSALMQAGKQSLVTAGTFSKLESHWRRIEIVAPLIRDRIARVQKRAFYESQSIPWSAETAYEVLESEGYRDISIVDSHLGNCATVRAVKP